MKRSYKLIGLFWDGKSIPENKPSISFQDHIGVPDSTIRLSEVLLLQDGEMADFSGSDFESLLIDWMPDVKYPPIWNFYIKRLLQIADYLGAKLVCDKEEYILKINDFISYFYKFRQIEAEPS